MSRQGLWLHEALPGSPWDNMALDAALLTALNEGSAASPTVRIYQWDRLSVSYGRLQSEAAIQQRYPDIPRVRRPTGGRAVLHGKDLTITVATLAEWLPYQSGEGVMSSYRQILSGVAAALNRVGIPVTYGQQSESQSIKTIIDCFDLKAGCDLMDSRDGRKLLGSAQRREGKAILQQMSLPLTNLADLPEFVGVLKEAFLGALQIEGWLTIDRESGVWYTVKEESEEVCPWLVKS